MVDASLKISPPIKKAGQRLPIGSDILLVALLVSSKSAIPEFSGGCLLTVLFFDYSANKQTKAVRP